MTAAPMWALQYVARLVAFCHYQPSIHVLQASEAFFDEIGKGADGCCIHLDDGDEVLVIRNQASDDPYWHDVLAHEFAHALHADIDRYALQHLPTEALAGYCELSEAFAPLLGGFLQTALPRWKEVSTDESRAMEGEVGVRGEESGGGLS
jgi:hypothetical protein